MDPRRFREVVRHLKGRYEIVGLDRLLDRGRPCSSGRMQAVISFDDGYRDFLGFAHPILRELGVPSSMQLITGCIDSGLPPWTYQLDEFFLRTRRLRFSVDTGILPESLRRTQWDSKEEQLAYARRLKPVIKGLRDADRHRLFEGFRSAMDDVELSRDQMLSWEDVRLLHRDGVAIGSHTVSHPVLPLVEDDDAVRAELVDSRRRIAEVLGKAPAVLAYPGGCVDERVKSLSREAGYEVGLAVGQTEYDDGTHGLFEVPRIELYDEPILKTWLREEGIIERVKGIVRRFR
jgi:peptidoglycan/xylan/chitin deacetylase (PgdA/CDA1 family)